MIAAAALACTLSFTPPRFEPDLRDTLGGQARACWDSSRFQIPERPLRARIYRWRINDRLDSLVLEYPVTPGVRETPILSWDGSPTTFCVTTRDPSGNESCRACVARGNWPVSVDPPGEPPLPPLERPGIRRAAEWETRARGAEWFDVSGRRLRAAPASAGIYVEIAAGAPPWKFVVLQ